MPAKMVKFSQEARDKVLPLLDKGAAAMMEGERVEFVALPGRRAVQDLDTPEDWDAWRAETDHPR